MAKKFTSLKDYIDLHLLLNEKNKNNELEIRFGTSKKYSLSKLQYDNIIKILKTYDFTSVNETGFHTLKINNDKSTIRTEILDLYYIQEYCKNNSLETIIKNYPDNITFLNKSSVQHQENTISNLDNDEYNFRIAYSTETNLLFTDKDVISIISNPQPNKTFRYINRVSYVNPNFPLIIDCTIVKSVFSTNMKNIEQSRLFNAQEHFEVEIEINNDTCSNYNSTQLYKKIQTVIKYVLSGIQESFYPISNSDILNVKFQYEKLLDIKKLVFCGPSSVTLQLEHLNPDNPNNILTKYTVTDKADGLRKLLFIDSKGKLYFITQNIQIQYTGVNINNPDLFNTIIDGEHITHDKNDVYINTYATFDIYYINNKSIRNLPLIKSNDKPTSRLDILSNTITKINKHISNDKIINITIKTFDIIYDDTTLYEQCDKLFTRIENDVRYNYNIDGIIFTPANLSVGSDMPDAPPSIPSKNTWKRSFKWKPPEYNTIDFLVTFPTTEPKFVYVNDDSLNRYQIIHLRVGYNIKRDGFLNPFKNVIDGDFQHDSTNYLEDYRPALFYPSNPYDNNTHICYILLKTDANGTPQMFTKNNEIFTENMIVEFEYIRNYDTHHQWVPLKVRYDKTYALQNGFKSYGNDFIVANNNWRSIHYPISKDMLISGNISSFNNDSDVYYKNVNKSQKRSNLRLFHNYIKELLIKYSATSPDSILLDLAVGKGGDIYKWSKNYNIKFVLGIDFSRDNIENKIDGACKRFIDIKMKDKLSLNAIFLSGDSSKNIKKGDAFTSAQTKVISAGIFGNGPNSISSVGKVVHENFGIAKNGFNIASCQFALHYFFQSKETLQNFIINLVDCIEINGLFIGTCYNGKTVFDLLKDKPSVDFHHDDQLILNITKKYKSDTFLDDITSLGYSIEVFQESINKSFIEYLVNFDFFIRIMENYGFKLKTLDENPYIKSSIDSFESIYNIISNDTKFTHMQLTSVEQSISFLNSYFIFEKIRHVNTNNVIWDDIDEIDSLDYDDDSLITPPKIKLKLKTSKK